MGNLSTDPRATAMELLRKLDEIARKTPGAGIGLPLDRPGRQTPLLIGAVSEWASPYVDEVVRLRSHLANIQEMTDADNSESYRADDREGCLDSVYARAKRALEGSDD